MEICPQPATELTDSDIDDLMSSKKISSEEGTFLKELKDPKLAMLHYRKAESLDVNEQDAIEKQIADYKNSEPKVKSWRPEFTVATTSLPGVRQNSERTYEVRQNLEGGGYRVVAEFSGSNDSKAQANREATRRNKMAVDEKLAKPSADQVNVD